MELIEVQNISNQLVHVFVAESQTDSDFESFGLIALYVGRKITVESERIDRAQIEDIAKKGLISFYIYEQS